MPVDLRFENFNHTPQVRTIPDATTGAAGVMSAADKSKLDGIPSGGGGGGYTNVLLAPGAGSTNLGAGAAWGVFARGTGAQVNLPTAPTIGNLVDYYNSGGLNGAVNVQNGAHGIIDINGAALAGLPDSVTGNALFRYIYAAANTWQRYIVTPSGSLG